MHFEVESTLTKERLRRFNYWNQWRRNYTSKYILLFAVLLALYMVFVMIAFSPPSVELVLFFLAVVASLVVFCTKYAWSASSQFRKIPEDVLTERFVFDDETFEVFAENSRRLQTHAKVRYSGLYRVVEEWDAFYLYTQDDQAFLLDKDAFGEESTDELSIKLQDVAGANFHWGK